MGTNNPSTFLTAGNANTALGIGSAALGAIGSLQQGSAAQSAANAQSDALMVQSNQAIQSARDQATVIRRNGASAQGAARAAAAASGVVADDGSAKLAADTVGDMANNDALAAITNGSRQAVALQTNAQQTRAAGQNAASASKLTALASGVTAYSRWKMAKSAVANGYGGSYNSFDNPDNYG